MLAELPASRAGASTRLLEYSLISIFGRHSSIYSDGLHLSKIRASLFTASYLLST